MEIQLWSSTGAHPNRPVAGDILLGSVYILLADLLTSRGNVRYVLYLCVMTRETYNSVFSLVGGIPCIKWVWMIWASKLCMSVSLSVLLRRKGK